MPQLAAVGRGALRRPAEVSIMTAAPRQSGSLRGSARPARSRPSPASSRRAGPGANGVPGHRPASAAASAASAAVDHRRPHAPAASSSSRMRRLVALSSTTRTGRPPAPRLGGSGAGASLAGGRERGGEVERAALARPRSRPRSARPSARPAATRSQAEAGAAVLARRRAVGLREGLEDRSAACPAGCRCRCRAR